MGNELIVQNLTLSQMMLRENTGVVTTTYQTNNGHSWAMKSFAMLDDENGQGAAPIDIAAEVHPGGYKVGGLFLNEDALMI